MAKIFEVVIAFEPVPEIYEKLNINIKLNGLSNVLTKRQAVSDKSGTAAFAIRSSYDNSGGLNNGMGSLVKFDSFMRQEITVAVETLDTNLASRLGRVGLIKIDVEGAEDLVLKGGGGLIRKDRPIVISEVLFSKDSGHTKWRSLVRRFELFPPGYRHFVGASGRLVQIVEADSESLEDFNLISIPAVMASDLLP